MSALLPGVLKTSTAIAVMVGAMAFTSFDADAKRIKIGGGGSSTRIVPVPRSRSAAEEKTSDDRAAATLTPVDAEKQDAQRAEAFELAKRKLAAERSNEGRATAQVNTSATIDASADQGVVCLAGCWRRN